MSIHGMIDNHIFYNEKLPLMSNTQNDVHYLANARITFLRLSESPKQLRFLQHDSSKNPYFWVRKIDK